jgi:SAM-dependent methyltransferase
MDGTMASCGLCGSERSTLVQQGVRHAPSVEVRRCEDCGLVYLWPRPSQAQLDAYYRATYRTEYDNPSLEETTPEALARIERLRPFLKRETRLLEIGAGTGAFLAAVREHVSEAVGIEPEQGTIVDDASGKFDLIVLFHVLEHVADPVRFLSDLRDRLAEDGRIVVEVPNIDDALVGVYAIPAYLPFYFQKAHVYYFSAATLGDAFARAGLIATISGVQRYDLSNHLFWALEGKPGGQGHYGFLGDASHSYEQALVETGIQDTLWAYGTRSRSD